MIDPAVKAGIKVTAKSLIRKPSPAAAKISATVAEHAQGASLAKEKSSGSKSKKKERDGGGSLITINNNINIGKVEFKNEIKLF